MHVMRSCHHIPVATGKFDRLVRQAPNHSRNDRPDRAALTTVLA
jgi:hypothetical protein